MLWGLSLLAVLAPGAGGIRCHFPLIWKADYERVQSASLAAGARTPAGTQYLGEVYVDAVHGRTLTIVSYSYLFRRWSAKARFFTTFSRMQCLKIYRVRAAGRNYGQGATPPDRNPEMDSYQVVERNCGFGRRHDRGMCRAEPYVTAPSARHHFLRSAAFHRLPGATGRIFALGGMVYVEFRARDAAAGQVEWWRFHAHPQDHICRPVAYTAALVRPVAGGGRGWAGFVSEHIQFSRVSLNQSEVVLRTIPDLSLVCSNRARLANISVPLPTNIYPHKLFVDSVEIFGFSSASLPPRPPPAIAAIAATHLALCHRA